MLHTKYCGNRPAGSGEDFEVFFSIYGCGGHLCHVTQFSHNNFPHSNVQVTQFDLAIK